MSRKRIEDRVGPVKDIGMGVLDKYKMVFNRMSSKDGSGKANIIPANGSKVFGVVYDLSLEQMNALDGHEQGYDNSKCGILIGGKIEDARVYIAQAEKTKDGLMPTKEYLEFLIQGAREHNFPQSFVEFLEKL